VPPILLVLNSVELRDVSNFSIFFDGTYVIGNATTPKQYMLSIVNSVFGAITGNPIFEASTNNYTYGLMLGGGLPSLIAPLTGIMSNFYTDMIRYRGWPCAVRVGDGSDLQISEMQLNMQTNYTNCAIEANGSQVIVAVSGNLMCEPKKDPANPANDLYAYPKGAINSIGAMVYQNGGEAVTSVGGATSSVVRVSQCSSSLYGNPFGSAKLTGVHVEGEGAIVTVQNASGIVGSSDSKYSAVSFSNCQGSLLNGGATLIAAGGVTDYEGTISADSECNFYTSSTRTSF